MPLGSRLLLILSGNRVALGGGIGDDGINLGSVVGSGSGSGSGKDLLFIGLPIGINHWSIGAEASQAIFLNMAMLLAEMANNSFRFIIVSVEGVEVGLEWQLPLSDADRVDGF